MVFIQEIISSAAKGANPVQPAGQGGHSRVPIHISSRTRTEVRSGGHINIQATADMSTRLQWYRDSERLRPDESLGIIVTDSVLVDGKRRYRLSLLTVEEVDHRDSGVYWCKAADNAHDRDRVRITVGGASGPATTPSQGPQQDKQQASRGQQQARVPSTPPKHVTPKPAKVSASDFKDTNHSVKVGGTIHLKSTSGKDADLVWYRGEERLTNDVAKETIITHALDAKRATKTSMLSVSGVTEEQGGVYTCIDARKESMVTLIIVKVTPS